MFRTQPSRLANRMSVVTSVILVNDGQGQQVVIVLTDARLDRKEFQGGRNHTMFGYLLVVHLPRILGVITAASIPQFQQLPRSVSPL